MQRAAKHHLSIPILPTFSPKDPVFTLKSGRFSFSEWREVHKAEGDLNRSENKDSTGPIPVGAFFRPGEAAAPPRPAAGKGDCKKGKSAVW